MGPRVGSTLSGEINQILTEGITLINSLKDFQITIPLDWGS